MRTAGLSGVVKSTPASAVVRAWRTVAAGSRMEARNTLGEEVMMRLWD